MCHNSQEQCLDSSLSAMDHQSKGTGVYFDGFWRLQLLLTFEVHWEVLWRPCVNHGVALVSE